jgi:hypothetical protein
MEQLDHEYRDKISWMARDRRPEFFINMAQNSSKLLKDILVVGCEAFLGETVSGYES